MTKYRRHQCYGARSQITQFLRQSTDLTQIKSAVLTIVMRKGGQYVTDSEYLQLPFAMNYYKEMGCDVPNHHLSSKDDTDKDLAEYSFKCSYVFSNDFIPPINWLEEIAKSMVSNRVAVTFYLSQQSESINHELKVKSMTVYSLAQDDIDEFTSVYSELGIRKRPLFSFKDFDGLSLDTLETILTEYPTRLSNECVNDDLIRPPLLNKFGKPALLESLPSFFSSPVSIWKGKASADFCDNYIGYLLEANRRIKHLAVASPYLQLPHCENEYSLLYPLDTVALSHQLFEVYPELNVDDEIASDMFRDLFIEFAIDSIFRTADRYGISDRDKVVVSHLINDLLTSESNFESISEVLAKLRESDHIRNNDARLIVVDELHNYYSNLDVEDYTPMFELFSNDGDKIVFRSNKDDHVDHCNLAVLTSFILYEMKHRERKNSYTFNLPPATYLVQFDMVTSRLSMALFSILRRARMRMIAPFILTTKDETDESLYTLASHCIEPSTELNEFKVKGLEREINIRTSNLV